MRNKILLFIPIFLLSTLYLFAQGVGIGTSAPAENASLSLTPPDGNGRNLIFRDASDASQFEMRTDGNSWALANATDGINFLAAVKGEGTFVYTDFYVSGSRTGLNSFQPSVDAALTITPFNATGKNIVFRDLSDTDRFEMRTDANSWALADANTGSNFIAAVVGEGTFVQTDFYVSGSRTGLNTLQPSVDATLSITPFNASGKNMVFRDLSDNDRFEVRTDGNSWALADASNGANFIAAVYNSGVLVQTDFSVTGAKNFVMDHPLDPANKLLRHACMESPEVLNVYSGTVSLDEMGHAVVQLPAYFESINKDFRYQLTAVGGAAPALHIAKEVEGNSFTVAGGLPGMKVSWQVTGVRNDVYFQDNPYQAEAEKTAKDKGRYYYPKGYGQPVEMGVNQQR